MKKVDLTNKRCGKVLVVGRLEGSTWECLCDCGEKCRIRTSRLLHRPTVSCGCHRQPDLTGKKFGRLKVLRKAESKNGRRFWECQCDCGNTVQVSHSKLVTNWTKSCGCYKRDQAVKRQWRGCGEISGNFWRRIVNQAKSRNLSIDITIEDAWNLFLSQGRKCKLTALTLVFSTGCRKTDGTASLDRIDSSFGYTKGNVQWIHKEVNRMKMDLVENHFIDLCRKVVKVDDENSRNKRRNKG